MTDLVTKTLAPVRTEMSLQVLAYGLIASPIVSANIVTTYPNGYSPSLCRHVAMPLAIRQVAKSETALVSRI